MKLISLVIPTYRSQDSIDALYKQILNSIGRLQEKYLFEYVFVEDGSEDNSVNLLKKLREEDKRIKIIVLSRNFGQVQAVSAGLEAAKGDAVVIFSADLQEPIELIPEMIKNWEEGNEVVIGYRKKREDKFMDKLFSKIFYRIIRLSIKNMPTSGYDFALLDKTAVYHLVKMESHYRFLQGDILSLGFNIKLIPCARKKRHTGVSPRTLNARIDYFLTGLLTTQIWPIRFTFLVAFAIIFCMFVFSLLKFSELWLLIICLYVMLILIFLSLGLIIEHLWRLSKEVSNHPKYIIKEKILD